MASDPLAEPIEDGEHQEFDDARLANRLVATEVLPALVG